MIILVMLAASVGVGYGVGVLMGPGLNTSGTSTNNSGNASRGSGVYHLILVETMNAEWNATVSQPKFFVLGDHGLESAANLSLPLHTLIELTIISYDTPTSGSTDQMGVVSGTVGGNMYLLNGTMASMEDEPMPWGMNVTSTRGEYLAHTFTIPQLGINVPVVGGDTQIAYLYLTKAGTFTWICEPPCGFGPNGMGGTMSQPGWMEGSVTVS